MATTPPAILDLTDWRGMVHAKEADEPAGLISQELEWLAHWYARKWQGKRGVQIVPRDRLDFQNVVFFMNAEPLESFKEEIQEYFSLTMVLTLETFSEITHFIRPVRLLRALEREFHSDSGAVVMHQMTFDPPSNVKKQ